MRSTLDKFWRRPATAGASAPAAAPLEEGPRPAPKAALRTNSDALVGYQVERLPSVQLLLAPVALSKSRQA